MSEPEDRPGELEEFGGKQYQRDTLRTLGLRRMSQSAVREDRPEVLGMIQTVRHLVTVEEVD